MDAETLEIYRQAAHQREQARRAQAEARRQRALQVAQRAAALLKREFTAERVVAFGSLVQPELFHARSDIDLAAWGMDERHYFRAVGVLQSLEVGFEIDLVMFEDAKPGLQEVILREGVEL